MTPAMTRVQAGYLKFPYYYYLLKHVKRRLATDGFVEKCCFCFCTPFSFEFADISGRARPLQYKCRHRTPCQKLIKMRYNILVNNMHASLVACSYFYILKTLVFIVWIRVFGLKKEQRQKKDELLGTRLILKFQALSLHPLYIQTPSFDAFFRLILLLADPFP
ncbi:Uncharacterized protein HZ326_30976 [Fusarium oxysporum f. sp. albedinis]|nr:Uncharacterized protein HZ326_30976 [Fusarium oxysporum f. sp. albedinis]